MGKIPWVPPIYDNNRYVTDFKEKCQLLNSYFSAQCILLKNISTLPNTSPKYTKNILDNIVFSKEHVYKLIKNLGPNKAHGQNPWNNFSKLLTFVQFSFRMEEDKCCSHILKNVRNNV